MLNRWHKLIAVAALAMALPVVANAQTSRVEGLSVQGDYIKDYTAIYTYPSQISHVGNLVYGEFGDGGTTAASDRAVGAVLGNLWEGRFGTWGIHLRSTTPNLGSGDNQTSAGIGDNGSDQNDNPYHAFDLMWGKRFGGTSLGIRLNRSVGTAEINNATTMTTVTLPDSANFGRNLFGFSAGVGFEVNPSTTFEGSLLYESRTFERTANPPTGVTNVAEDSPTSYLLAARLMWQWQPNVLVVPVLKYWSYDYSAKRTVAGVTTTSAATQKGWQLGGAGNWTLNQNDLFVLGATFSSNTIEQDNALFATTTVNPVLDPKKITESIYPQVFAALETHVNPWLTLRFGATQDVYAKIKADPRVGTADAVQETFSRFAMNLGAGVKVGGLQFDATMDSDMFNNFTRLSANNAPAFPRVTATYSF